MKTWNRSIGGRVALATALLVALAAHRVLALDVQGTWSGKMVCNGYDGEKYKTVYENSVLKVTQTGTSFVLDFNNGNYRYAGTTIDAAGDTTTGEIGVSMCESPGEAETGRAKIKNDKLKGTSIYRDGGSNETCKWKYTRTDTADPGISACLP